MSYLNPPRLSFAGRFRANPATVNNDIVHYRTDTFKAEYQATMTGTAPDNFNGWWNPAGDGTWRLIGCTVCGVTRRDGTTISDSAIDPAIGLRVVDSGNRVSAKMVDLDPQQQTASELWGLAVRICDATGTELMGGEFEVSAFMDIWLRRIAPGAADANMSAYWQSVLTKVRWSDLSRYPFLQELAATTQNGMLSIKFNVDRYCGIIKDPNFRFGRIYGSIGPYFVGEPHSTVRGRHFQAAFDAGGRPVNALNSGVAVLDPKLNRIHVDLGNTLPEPTPPAPDTNPPPPPAPPPVPPLTLGYIKPGARHVPSTVVAIEAIANIDATWCERTGGVISLPVARDLTDVELADLQNSRLALITPGMVGPPTVLLAEGLGGYYIRGDRLVARLNPGDSVQVPLYADRFGQPYANASVLCLLDNSGLSFSSYIATADNPEPLYGTPASALQFPALLTTNSNGCATLAVTASDPGNPRGYIDGQVFGVRYHLMDTLQGGGNTGYISQYAFSPFNFLSLLVWSKYEAPAELKWEDVEPILKQFGNLFPVMKPLVDLGDSLQVIHNRHLLRLVFELPIEDPNYMPVSRDLSTAKRQTLLRWLTAVDAIATSRENEAKPFPSTPGISVNTTPTDAAALGHQGDKAAALARLQAARPQ